MADVMIKVHDLSKCYRIGAKEKGYQTIREALISGITSPVRNLARLRNLTKFNIGVAAERDVLWALKDVSFEVKRGEVLGIIGRNGAGKSTLLKILSRVTEPTSGSIEMYGRVSSLLEVGTGFHPELTGRENIFLNGAILGMKKKEIEEKFDQIVAFSEIEQFLDTPVKRYSSGMYIRLAFAVAAHLDPEILVVDEVLAVGDTSFQKKCLGKMDEVAKGGRTVIFVSHNLHAIRTLCGRGVWINNGRIECIGSIDDVANKYEKEYLINSCDESSHFVKRELKDCERKRFYFKCVEMTSQDGVKTTSFKYGETITLLCELAGDPEDRFSPEFRIYNDLRQIVATGAAESFHSQYFGRSARRVKIVIGPVELTSGKYHISLSAAIDYEWRDTWENAITFTITECRPFPSNRNIESRHNGPCVINHAFFEVSGD